MMRQTPAHAIIGADPEQTRSSPLPLLVAAALLSWSGVALADSTWRPTSLVGAPTARYAHSAVWTGSRMIVWGGFGCVDDSCTVKTFLQTGGLYDPATDTWSTLSTVGAPAPRSEPTVVWTGSKMIIWGGISSDPINTGAMYDPVTDTWTPTSTVSAPVGRIHHTAVWTGSRMMIWGGWGTGALDLNTGGLYDPATDRWTQTSMTGAPTPRSSQSALWTGSRVLVWGGEALPGGTTNTGGFYDPTTDRWTATGVTGAPSPRAAHTAVWTGQKMVVFGGIAGFRAFAGGGGVYDPLADTWTRMNAARPPFQLYPLARNEHTAVWNGLQMVVWGGGGSFDFASAKNTGGIFDEPTDTWTPTNMDAPPSARQRHTAVWTGSQMIVWGGSNPGPEPVTKTGGLFETHWSPATQTSFYPITPFRVADTRLPWFDGTGFVVDPVGANSNRAFVMYGAEIPSTARAVSLNVTVTEATSAGNLRLYPVGTPVPAASVINYGAGQTRATGVIAPLGDLLLLGARVDQGSGHVHVIIDVNGYFW